MRSRLIREKVRRHDIVVVLSLYVVLSCCMTWPLVAGLARDVPGDLGDSLLNMWILGWGAEALPRVVAGNMTLTDAANANIFHPEPFTLALSEHLFGQVVQILPVYHLTGNLVLSYNLLFISTYVLSGLGMYLLVRDVTGNRYAAFLSGLVFAFSPYRLAQIGHLQSLSSQWMPLALYGFRRFIVTSRPLALVGGAAALLMQNWSCGYYLMFFAPFVVLFVVHQIVACQRGRELRVWLSFSVAAAVVAVGTWPFLALYLEAQRIYRFERPLGEIVGFSADVYSYLTASESLRIVGPFVQAWPKPEGELFLGFVPMLLAVVGFAAAVTRAKREALLADAAVDRSAPRWRLVVAGSLVVAACVIVTGLAGILLTGGFATSVAGIRIRATNAPRLIAQLLAVFGVALLVSRTFRSTVRRTIHSSAGIAAISLLFAVWFSLGPIAHTRGLALDGLGLYNLLLDHVPGFDGLRVPARYAMLAAVYVSVLAGIGAASLAQSRPRAAFTGPSSILALGVVFLMETAFVPMPMNQTWGDGPVVPPPHVEPASRAPAVYRHVADMRGPLVLAEFPFGDPAWELRYVYYSTVHWKPILNGYSGSFPQRYKVRVARLQRYAEDPDAAWLALNEAGTTHVLVHEAALPAGEADTIRSWLQSRGGREVGRFDRDVLYDLQDAP